MMWLFHCGTYVMEDNPPASSRAHYVHATKGAGERHIHTPTPERTKASGVTASVHVHEETKERNVVRCRAFTVRVPLLDAMV